MKILKRLFLILTLAGAPFASYVHAQVPMEQMTEEAARERAELIISHNINLDEASMIHFLKNGFNTDGLAAGLPRFPRMKSEVVNAVIIELGLKRSSAALPVLTAIVKGDPPRGVAVIVQSDFESYPLERADDQRALMRDVLALNAVVALGLIGDETVEPVILERMRTAKGTAFITKGAIALGQMGSNKGIGPVVLLARNIESADSVVAFHAIYILTGRNYGYTENTSIKKRKELVNELNLWYEESGADVEVYRSEVLRRQNVPINVNVLDTRSLRGLLRKSYDAQDYDGRYAAREKLSDIAGQSFDELLAIVEDEMEDVDIRRAAMRWLVVSDAGKAEKFIKRQRADENPLVAGSAETILKDIPAYKKAQQNK